VLVDQTVTFLEMNSPDQLVPGRPPPPEAGIEPLGPGDEELAHDIWTRIGAPHNWTERTRWSRERWSARLAPPAGVWIARVGGRAAGMFELEAQPEGTVEITVFGLTPEFTGKGLGGWFLEAAVRLAWELGDAAGEPARRVWLHTSSLDHPHAQRNYEARGFRVYRREYRPREIPD
jgi:GNAT superfamily N-acetyltransferase